MNNLISVIVPVFNVKDYLNECVESILNQTYTNLEVVLVDDGSTDNSSKICDEYAEKDSRVKVIHQQNKGQAESRQIGINASCGEYLYFVDSDDYIELDLIEKVMNVFSEKDVDIVNFEWDTFGKGKIPSPEKICEGVLTSKQALGELVKGNINNYFVNKVYKRQVFAGVDFLKNRLWEDMGVMYSVFINAKSIYCLPQKLYHYRMRSGSTINTITEKALEDIFFVQTKRYNDLVNIYPDIAEVAFLRVPFAAIRLYDRSLWKKVDDNALQNATEFLEKNKNKILKVCDKKRFNLYYKNRKLYNKLRLLRHKVGNLVKKIK